MSGFSTDWLALREPFDSKARGDAFGARVLRPLAERLRADDADLNVIDLACGTGANLRELAPHLGGSQRWLLVDHDPRLLDAVPTALQAWADSQGLAFRDNGGLIRVDGADWHVDVERQCVDLARGLDSVPFERASLVSASALLDLVSASWLDELIDRCHAARAAMLFALSVDGRMEWAPGDPDDAFVQRLFTAHQDRDKGFGAALGAASTGHAAKRLAERGYGVDLMPSDWRIDGREGNAAMAMIGAMVQGIAAAASEQDMSRAGLVEEWKSRRLAQADASCLHVGHQDIMAALP